MSNAANNGAENMKAKMQKVLRTGRVLESLQAHGLTLGLVTRAKASYTHRFTQLEVAGDTYPIKATLKALGFHWNPTYKVWAIREKPFAIDQTEIAANILREVA